MLDSQVLLLLLARRWSLARLGRQCTDRERICACVRYGHRVSVVCLWWMSVCYVRVRLVSAW